MKTHWALHNRSLLPIDSYFLIHEQRSPIVRALAVLGSAASCAVRAFAIAILAILVNAGLPFTVQAQTDTTPPTVSITSPTPGAIVSGVILVSASASDNVGVVGVQFKYDGINF